MSNLPDFTNYDDDKLEAARAAVLAEQERRARLAAIPTQVQQLAQAYADMGGDVGELSLEPLTEQAPVTGEPEGEDTTDSKRPKLTKAMLDKAPKPKAKSTKASG